MFPNQIFVNQKGLTLIGLIAAMLVLSLLAVGILTVVTTGLLTTGGTSDASAAFFAAETGISVEKVNLITNSAITNFYTNTGSIAGATYSAEITWTTNYPPLVTITSTGRKNDSQWKSVWTGTSMFERAIVVYRHTTSNRPQYRVYASIYDVLKFLCPEQYPESVGGDPEWQRIVASPVTNQFLLVTQNNSREIYAQACSNGVWTNCTRLNGSGPVPEQSQRGFDVAYESLSGRGMAVYSTGSNACYRTWTNGWSPPTTITTNIGATGDVRWVRLVPKPDSNEIMLLARWKGTKLIVTKKGKTITTNEVPANFSSATIWNGSGWTNSQSLEDGCESEIEYETMDAAWSTNSALVVYINGDDEDTRVNPKSRTYTTSSGWIGGEGTVGSLGNQVKPRWMRVEFSRNNTNAYAVFLYTNEQNKDYLKGSLWDGTWNNYHDFQGDQLHTSAERDVDIAWSSQSNLVMAVYCGVRADEHSYMTYVPGDVSPVYGSEPMASIGWGNWSVLKADPRSSDFLYISLDKNNDVNLQRWDGSSWILIKEVQLKSDTDYNSIDIAFTRDLSTP